MRKYILAALTFMMFACSLGEQAPRQAKSALTNIPTSISNGTLPTGKPGKPAAKVTNAAAFSTPTVTPPAPNPQFQLLSVQLQAIQVSDDDGTRTTDITSQQVKEWIDKANEIFAKAGIRFQYDPALDFASLNDTLVNDVIGDTDSNWTSEVEAGNRDASRYPGKLVVFFRNGPGKGRTGGGFSWSDYNFVAMPGFDNTSVCGYSNMGALAHEVGHYLGLAHPFANIFTSAKEAEAYLSAHGNDPKVFDGDGLSDTPPDPFINTPQYQCNPAMQSVTLNGQVFPLPRQNVMSYYSNGPQVDRTDLTPQQISIVRWILTLRERNQMATPTDRDVPGATEFTTLAITNRSKVEASVQDMSTLSKFLWNGNKQLFGSAELNGSIGFSISVPQSGKYELNVYGTMAPDYGKIQTLLDGNPVGPPIDLYSLIILPTGRVSLGTINLTGGKHTLGFRVISKNSASTGYSFGLNEFNLMAQ